MRGRFLLAVLGLLLSLALSLGPAQANYWEGHEAFRRGDYATAHRAFLPLARQGHAAAQFNLGYLHHHGLAVPRDPVEAARWYRAAAAQGRVEAQFSLGTLYETGAGVARDLASAYRWYNLAAGNVPPGPSRDRLLRHRARIAGRLAADQQSAVEAAPVPAGFAPASESRAPDAAPAVAPGVADIQRALAARDFNPGAIDGEMGRTTLGALSAFQASVGLAVTGAADPATLAKLFGPEEVAPYLEPFPRPAPVRSEPAPPAVPLAPVEAVALEPYEPAAKPAAPQADVRAEVESAGDVRAGSDPAGGDPSGAGSLRRLAERGDAGAQIALATRYHYGQGVEEDRDEAIGWYARAARQGRIDALFPLGSLYESRAGGTADLVEAYRWYGLAADLVPAGKAREIIVQRRDRVAERLPAGLAAAARGETPPKDRSEAVAHRNRPVPSTPASRPPGEAALTASLVASLAASLAATVSEAANEAPRDLGLALGGTVAENAPAGTVVGRVEAVDPDAGDRLTYSLVEEADGRFVLNPETGRLSVAEGASLDFEALAGRFSIDPETGLIVAGGDRHFDPQIALGHRLIVRAADSAGLAVEAAVAIRIADINERPWLDAGAFVVEENAPAGTPVGRVRAGDPDGGAKGDLAFRLADDAGGRFAIDAETGEIVVADGARLDLEAEPAFRLRVAATDGGGLSADAPIVVAVADRNEPSARLGTAAGGNGAAYAEELPSAPDHYGAYFNRGLIHYAESRYDRAVEDFGKVIGLRPDHAGAYVNRANAYYRQGRYASAARDYLRAAGIWLTPW